MEFLPPDDTNHKQDDVETLEIGFKERHLRMYSIQAWKKNYEYGKFKGHFSLQYNTISPHKCMYEETISGLNSRKLTCFN